MGEHSEGQPVVFRNRSYVAFGWAALLFAAFLFGLGASSIGGGGTFGVAVIFAIIGYMIWLLGCHSAVRMNGSEIILEDVLTRHVIPWPELRGIEVRGGLVFEVRGGPNIRMWMYGGSLYGLVTGYRLQRKVAARMNAARKRLDEVSSTAPEHSPPYTRKIAFSPWPPLVLLIVMEAIAAVAVFSK
jgi:hypothetical protein